ncbi:MAG: glycerate 2-kinase [Acidobacteriaceae bacterium]|nr:glycerate 2-kinase [Acidobacteriaceae bacterium]
MARLPLFLRCGRQRSAHTVIAMPNDEDDAAPLQSLHEDARAIFAHALDACGIQRVFGERVRCEGTTLVIEHSPLIPPPIPVTRIDLSGYRKILIIALGKAAVPMTESLLGILPRKLRVRGICSAPAKPDQRDWRIRYYAGGHPLPNHDSFRAARTALRLLRRASDKTIVIYLISGGGSTLFDLPLDPEISLADTIAFHEALIASGATIAEINTLRKHFSAVKGGRLATAATQAVKLTLQVVDVPSQHVDAVASGPTLPDPSTVDDCRELLDRYGLLEKFPPAVRRFFTQPHLPETPGDKAALQRGSADAGVTDPLFTLVSNDDLLGAARERATALGYEVEVDNGCDDWPYDRAAGYLVDRLIELRRQHPGRKLCLLSGGEVTVRIDRTPGTGGRNQQFALACALLFAQRLPGEPIVCLSAGSDGADGNSPAAGAIADPTTFARAQALGFEAEASLAAFDACPLFTALGDTLLTGPTGNNLRDLRILLSA